MTHSDVFTQHLVWLSWRLVGVRDSFAGAPRSSPAPDPLCPHNQNDVGLTLLNTDRGFVHQRLGGIAPIS